MPDDPTPPGATGTGAWTPYEVACLRFYLLTEKLRLVVDELEEAKAECNRLEDSDDR